MAKKNTKRSRKTKQEISLMLETALRDARDWLKEHGTTQKELDEMGDQEVLAIFADDATGCPTCDPKDEMARGR